MLAGMSTPGAGDPGEPFEPPGVTWTPVSRRLATLRRVLTAVPGLLLTLVAVVVPAIVGVPAASATALVPLAVTGWAWWLIGRQVRAVGYAERAEDLLFRRGVLMRRIVVVPYGRMQYVDVHAGPLDRAFGLARVQLHTASAATDASIPGLAPAEAARLRDRLSSLGQARLAGL